MRSWVEQVMGLPVSLLARGDDLDLGLDVAAFYDVVVRCPSGKPFRVGIEDPRDRSRPVAVVPPVGCSGEIIARATTVVGC